MNRARIFLEFHILLHHRQAGGGLGYDDLNQLMKSPEDLEFVIELLVVEHDYEKGGVALLSLSLGYSMTYYKFVVEVGFPLKGPSHQIRFAAAYWELVTLDFNKIKCLALFFEKPSKCF
jgi:hypothetical protein